MHLFVELITTLRVPPSDRDQVGRGIGALDLSPRGDKDRRTYDRDRDRDHERGWDRDRGRDRERDRDRDRDKLDKPPLRNEIARTSMNMNISSLSDTGTHTQRPRSNSMTPKRSIDLTKSASFFSRFSMKDNSLSRSTNGLPSKKDNSTSEFDDSAPNSPNWRNSRGKNRTSTEFRRRGVSADENVRGSMDSRLSRDSPRGRDNRSRGIRDFERDMEEEHEDDSPAVVEMCSGWVMIPIAGQYYTTLHCFALHCTALHCTALHCTALHCTALHYTTQHYTTLHYTTLHYTTLHYTTQHYTTPHRPATLIFTLFPYHVLATLRGSARKLRLTMCGGTPFAVVHIQGDDVPRRAGVWNSMKRYQYTYKNV